MKSREEKSRREKEKESEEKKIQAREMLRNSRNTVFFNDLWVARVEK